MILYVYDNYKGNNEAFLSTAHLIILALKQYHKEIGKEFITDVTMMPEILRTQKGKPYLENLPVHFSVSHSENLWVCLINDTENGVDIQSRNHRNYEAIAHRFYQPEEQIAVRNGGLPAFISIWCRKEAFIKYHGLTIGETIDWLNVAQEGAPAEQIEYCGHTIVFSDIDVHPNFLCVAATSTKDKIWIREIITD